MFFLCFEEQNKEKIVETMDMYKMTKRIEGIKDDDDKQLSERED